MVGDGWEEEDEDEDEEDEVQEAENSHLSAAEVEERRQHTARRELNRAMDKQEHLRTGIAELRSEAVRMVGASVFQELHDFFLQQAQKDDEEDGSAPPGEETTEEAWELYQKKEQEAAQRIYDFVFGKVSFENVEIINLSYRLLYLEEKLTEVQKEIEEWLSVVNNQ